MMAEEEEERLSPGLVQNELSVPYCSKVRALIGWENAASKSAPLAFMPLPASIKIVEFSVVIET